jgi:hypothetical protein
MRGIFVFVVLFMTLFTGGSALADLAYIDPGTGSVIFGAIFYVIVAGVAGVAAAVLAFITKPFKILHRKFFKKGEGEPPEKDKAEKKQKETV